VSQLISGVSIVQFDVISGVSPHMSRNPVVGVDSSMRKSIVVVVGFNHFLILHFILCLIYNRFQR